MSGKTKDGGAAGLPRCDELDGSTLRIVPAYTEAGKFCEANCVTITDGERTAIYVPLHSELRLAEQLIGWNGKRFSPDWSTYGDGAATEPDHKEAAFDQGIDTGKAQAVDAIRNALIRGDEMSKRKIATTCIYPPIPIRQFDWCAHDENYEPPDSDGVGGWPIGYGATEAEAIADYLQLVEDDQP